jgi:hypothetical protein
MISTENALNVPGSYWKFDVAKNILWFMRSFLGVNPDSTWIIQVIIPGRARVMMSLEDSVIKSSLKNRC